MCRRPTTNLLRLLKLLRSRSFDRRRLLVDDQTDGEDKVSRRGNARRVFTTTDESNGIPKPGKISVATPEDQLRSDLVSAAKPAVPKPRSLLNGARTAQQSVSASNNDLDNLIQCSSEASGA